MFFFCLCSEGSWFTPSSQLVQPFFHRVGVAWGSKNGGFQPKNRFVFLQETYSALASMCIAPSPQGSEHDGVLPGCSQSWALGLAPQSPPSAGVWPHCLPILSLFFVKDLDEVGPCPIPPSVWSWCFIQAHGEEHNSSCVLWHSHTFCDASFSSSQNVELQM